ncbi:MAG: bifunctional metallophosphatase/5'-nucleotidase [Deltaproteobacteria bacterium]|nr:bifunctional metallophosphatase/5'-nucleotidase [Deltaproteobacteria bacterium]
MIVPVLSLLATQSLELVYHSDIEGRLAVPLCAKTGTAAPDFAALVGAIEAAREEARMSGGIEPVVLLGGDEIGPDLFVRSMLKLDEMEGARRIATILKRASYDAVAIGNHDLELDLERLDRFAAALHEQKMPIVSTNLECDTSRNPFCAHLLRELVIERESVKIGVLAVLSPKIMTSIPAANREHLTISDPLPAVRDGVQRLRAAGANVVVLMVQLKSGAAGSAELRELLIGLGEMEGPDVVMSSGLAHADGVGATRLVRQDGAAPLVGSSIGAAGVTRVRMLLGEGVRARVDAFFEPSHRLRRDEKTAELLAPEVARYCERYGRTISPGPVKARLERDDFVRYALAVMRRSASAEVAMINVGFVKPEPFPIEGELTRAELLRAIPYHATLGTARMMGGALGELLKPALGNARVAILGAELVDGKVKINGRPLDAAREYTLATIPFVADGGDEILPVGSISLELDDEIDVRDLVEKFLESGTALEDGDPTIDAETDFGPPASQRLLVVGLADLGLDLSTTSISNDETSSDPRLTRAAQRAIKAELGLVMQLRHPWHENDTKLGAKFGYARTEAEGTEPVSAETDDLLLLSTIYSFRGFHPWLGSDSIFLPEPYLRGLLESELTVPEVTDSQARGWRHAELSVTSGALFTFLAKLKLRLGAGARKELGASASAATIEERDAARARFMLEAGATLDPIVISKLGDAPIKVEAGGEYFLLEPDQSPEQQVRASAKLSIPLVPLLFLTAGVELFGVERRPAETAPRAWAYSIDSTLGIRVHLDGAHQSL